MLSPYATAVAATLTVTTSDGASVLRSYSDNATTVPDQAGTVRRNLTDGLGRLSEIHEPDFTGNLRPITSPVQETSYLYDALDNLLQVTQGSQTRTFNYNSVSQLLSALNPENGTISYLYDANGNLAKRTETGRNIVTDYVFDELDRLK